VEAAPADIQLCARFAFALRAGRFRERALGAALLRCGSGRFRDPALGAALPRCESGVLDPFAAAASFRCDPGAFAVLRFGAPSTGALAARLPFRARTPSTATAAIVNFESNDIT
jgi:hypothetical protein